MDEKETLIWALCYAAAIVAGTAPPDLIADIAVEKYRASNDKENS